MELISLLRDALSGDNFRMKESEKKINQYASQNLGEFLFLVAEVLSNESENKNIRQISATIIRNILNFNQTFKGQWLYMEVEKQNKIKERVLSSLASNERNVRKAAALTVVGMYFYLCLFIFIYFVVLLFFPPLFFLIKFFYWNKKEKKE